MINNSISKAIPAAVVTDPGLFKLDIGHITVDQANEISQKYQEALDKVETVKFNPKPDEKWDWTSVPLTTFETDKCHSTVTVDQFNKIFEKTATVKVNTVPSVTASTTMDEKAKVDAYYKEVMENTNLFKFRDMKD